ncbi:MAG: hypothetical protein LBV19_04955 [Streptococcaceae bacterium]|jgi:hypothetical protein|nr:hypothetical protein [Streptococcaceae bacterium]
MRKNQLKFVAEEQVDDKLAVDNTSALFKIPNSSKGCIYHFSDLAAYTIYASGSPTSLAAVKERLKPYDNYLAYQSFTSLWIEFTLGSSEEVQRIDFFTSPIYTGQPQRRRYVDEACRVSEIFERILASKL